MIKNTVFILTFVFSFFVIEAFSYYSPGNPNGFVNDYSNTFNYTQETKLEEALSDFKRSTGYDIAVVVVKSFQGDTKENFAVKLYEDWKIGDSKDRGVLILVSRIDREIKIEVGYGLEGDLPDGYIAKEILNKEVLDFLSKDAYYSAISNIVNKIFIKLNYSSKIDFVETSTSPSPAIPGDFNQIYSYILLIIIFLVIYLLQKFGIIHLRKYDNSILNRKSDPFKFGGGRSGGGGSGAKF